MYEWAWNLESFVKKKNSVQYINTYNVKYSPKLWMYYTCLDCAERKKCKLFLMSDWLAVFFKKKNKPQTNQYTVAWKFPTCTQDLIVDYMWHGWSWYLLIEILSLMFYKQECRIIWSTELINSYDFNIYTNIQQKNKLILLLMLNANWNSLLMSHSPPWVALWGSQV